MRNSVRAFFVVALLALIWTAPIYAQSSQNALQVSTLKLIDYSPAGNIAGGNIVAADADHGTPILEASLHTSQQKDLVMSVSLECGVYTQTLVRSKGGNKDTSEAQAGVQVRVVVDSGMPFEREATPGWVTYCDRSQELSATLQGIIENTSCFGEDGDFDELCADLTAEEIELVLETLSANAFFFALEDLGSGWHTVTVEAKIITSTSVQEGEASANALVGKGSLIVDEIRLAHSNNILEP